MKVLVLVLVLTKKSYLHHWIFTGQIPYIITNNDGNEITSLTAFVKECAYMLLPTVQPPFTDSRLFPVPTAKLLSFQISSLIFLIDAMQM